VEFNYLHFQTTLQPVGFEVFTVVTMKSVSLLLTFFFRPQISSTLKMEPTRSSETSVLTRPTRRYIPEDGILNITTDPKLCPFGMESERGNPRLQRRFDSAAKLVFVPPTSKGHPVINANGARGHGSDELFLRNCSQPLELARLFFISPLRLSNEVS
jgi:hypothetical protein